VFYPFCKWLERAPVALLVVWLGAGCSTQRIDALERIGASCGDGVQNGTEAGIDCGGSCAPCASCDDGIQNGSEIGTDCGGVCLPCTITIQSAKSYKRGTVYHFCGWPSSGGYTDFHLLKGGIDWYYNWSSKELLCTDGNSISSSGYLNSSDPQNGVEFVPMVKGLADFGIACGSGGPCFVVDARDGGATPEQISIQQMSADIPYGSHYLLSYDGPNFLSQANLTPQVAARSWRHLEAVADERGLGLVGPGTNYCMAAEPGSVSACIPAVNGVEMQGLNWLEMFYDECTASGAAGHDCRIDHQAIYSFSCWGAHWIVDVLKRKAGLIAPTATHCSNAVQDVDERGIDCGGLDCTACSAWARQQFAKPVWLTEIGPAADRPECQPPMVPDILARSQAYIDTELPLLERDPFVFRYAWFMPKVHDHPGLDHMDLLDEQQPGLLTPLGENYLTEPF